jgi:ATP-dependent RNA helicase DDX23/PRP28
MKPVFLTKSEREKLKASLPPPQIKSSVVPERSRSPTRSGPVTNKVIKQKPVHKLKPIFRFEWDNSDDTTVLNPENSLVILPKALKSKASNYLSQSIPTQDLFTKPKEDMNARDWRILKENLNIDTKNCEILPVRSWNESGLDQVLLRGIRSAGYQAPTPIQMQAIPIGLKRYDLIGLSHTGSGKSAAYLLPILNHCLKLPRITFEVNQNGPYALIISPTRELAQQITEECEKLAKYCDIRVLCIIGGKNIEQQSIELRRGAEIIIATPGRLLELLQITYLVFNQCLWIVVDEADQILLLELEETVKQIFSYFPSETWKSYEPNELKQQEESNFKNLIATQVFSATMNDQIEKLWRRYLRNPSCVTINDNTKKVNQEFYFLDQSEKKFRLKSLLGKAGLPVLIFLNEKVEADNLSNYLGGKWKVGCLHGGKSQEYREAAMEKFREGIIEILICTNVLSRGIDVKYLKTVINYDCPKTIFDYEHRIGRTGRMGRKGNAITFITPQDNDILPQIKKFLEMKGHKVPKELEVSYESVRETQEILQ